MAGKLSFHSTFFPIKEKVAKFMIHVKNLIVLKVKQSYLNALYRSNMMITQQV
jgi:hypothetical protein